MTPEACAHRDRQASGCCGLDIARRQGDYVLFVGRQPVGVIEAKKDSAGENLTVTENQIARYANATMHEPRLQFQPRWKEELVCTCEQGSFILGMPMGVPSVDFPTEEMWQHEAPAWARPYWVSIRDQLAGWCESQGLPLHVGPFGHVYSMP